MPVVGDGDDDGVDVPVGEHLAVPSRHGEIGAGDLARQHVAAVVQIARVDALDFR
jgi:hypothetical protein